MANDKWDGKNQVPGNACHFVIDEGVCFADSADKNMVKLVGYRGDIIRHWFWGNLAFDMDGLRFDKPRTPGLIDHNTTKRLTYSKERNIKPETYIAGPFLDNANAQELAKDMKNEFPFQASLALRPELVEQVAEGQSVEVNGRKLKGPGAVFRKAAILEISAVVFGAFSNTESAAYSDTEKYNFELSNERDFDMKLTLEQLKTEYAELYNQVFELGKTEGGKTAVERFTRLQKACGDDNDLLVKCFAENLDTGDAMARRIEKLSAEKTQLAEQLASQNSKLSTQNLTKPDAAQSEFNNQPKPAVVPQKEPVQFDEKNASDDELKAHFKATKEVQDEFASAESYIQYVRHS